MSLACVEDFLDSKEARNAIRAYGLPIRPGQTSDTVVASMVAFLKDGAKRRYGPPKPVELLDEMGPWGR